jgi:hypothetical protein
MAKEANQESDTKAHALELIAYRGPAGAYSECQSRRHSASNRTGWYDRVSHHLNWWTNHPEELSAGLAQWQPRVDTFRRQEKSAAE